MIEWSKRIGAAVLLGLIWAAAWAPIGVLIGLIVDPSASMDEMWPAVGAYPGFISGVIFSVLLRVAEGRRSFNQVSLPRFAGWGAVSGLLVGVLPFAVGTPSSDLPAWLPGVVIGSTTLLSSISAVGSALLLRYATRERPPASA